MQSTMLDSPLHTIPENPFAMTPNMATNALRPSSAALAPQPSQSGQPVLTKAEQAVAVLVAEGARNHDIARQLGVSHRTVESHLSNIFTKLGFGSRVQLAVWISSSGPTEEA